jgi:hypothetical protein
MDPLTLAAGVILIFLATFLVWKGRQKTGKEALVGAVETSKVKGLTPGFVKELKGVVECFTPIYSPMTRKACVYYEYRKEKKTDKGYEKVESTVKTTPFFTLRDDTGAIIVEPADAQVGADPSYQKEEGDYRSTEYVLEVGKDIYAMGYISKGPESLVMSKHGTTFFLSSKSESEIIKGEQRTDILYYVGGLVSLAAGIYVMFFI